VCLRVLLLYLKCTCFVSKKWFFVSPEIRVGLRAHKNVGSDPNEAGAGSTIRIHSRNKFGFNQIVGEVRLYKIVFCDLGEALVRNEYNNIKDLEAAVEPGAFSQPVECQVAQACPCSNEFGFQRVASM
jgi:hypothetical protein